MQRITSIFFIFLGFAKAELTFDSKLKELHASADATELTCDFHFENTGTKVEEILSHETNCTCITAQLSEGGKRIYQPGEKGTLRAVFSMGNFSGTVDKQVVMRVKADAGESPNLTLTVRIHIPVLVQLDQNTVEWALDEVKKPKVIKVTMNDSQPIKITNVTTSNTDFLVSYKPITDGKEYEITVTPAKPDEKTPGIAVIRIETDSTNEKQKSQMGFALIRAKVPSIAPVPTATITPNAPTTNQP